MMRSPLPPRSQQAVAARFDQAPNMPRVADDDNDIACHERYREHAEGRGRRPRQLGRPPAAAMPLQLSRPGRLAPAAALRRFMRRYLAPEIITISRR